MEIFKHLPIAALLTNTEGVVLHANPRALSIFGENVRLVGENLLDFIHSTDRPEFQSFFQNLAEDPDTSFETILSLPGNQPHVQVQLKGSVAESNNRIFVFKRCDPYGPGCGKKCQYATILETQFQNNPGGILLVNEKMQMLSFNREFVKIWAIPTEILHSRDDQACLKSILSKIVDPERFMAKVSILYRQPETTSTDEVFLKDGRVLYRQSYPIHNGDSYLGRVWHFLDITQLKEADSKIIHQQIFHEAILDNIQDSVVACDNEGKINLLNKAGQRLFGFNTYRQIPETYAELPMFFQDDSPLPVESSPLSLALDGHSVNNFEITTRRKSGPKQSLRVSGQPMYDSENNQLGAVISLHNITDLKKARQQLHFMAHHDALTGLPNRRLFHDLLQQSLKQASRNNMQVGVLFLDLDNFKGVNDAHGHAVGDQVLIEVAACLNQKLRQSDIICRWGGDEFVIGVLDSSGSSGIVQVAEKLGKSVLECTHRSDEAKDISISIGIAVFPDHGSLPDRLIRNADVAMYRAKRQGKNRCELFNLN